MTESSLVLYRAQAVQKIEPIDLATIPDEGRQEVARIEKQIDEANTVLMDMRGKRSLRAGKIAFVYGTLPILSALFTGFWFGLLSLVALITACVAILVVNGILILAAHDLSLPETEQVLAINAKLERLRSRKSKFESLDRLTGNNQRAHKLLMEARDFNHDLSNLDEDTCSPSDALLIGKKRAEIAARIQEFRQLAIGAGENEPLKLLPEHAG